MAAATVSATPMVANCKAKVSKAPRNVLMIMADDMGAMELGCYGGKINLTPNFDALAGSGVLFSTFFATPVSTPSRVALMTGKYGINTGHLNMSNMPGGKGQFDLATEEYTFGQMFRDAGYATAMAGKWQLSGRGETLIHECGFDEYMSWAYLGNLPKGETYKGGYYPPNTKQQTSRYWHPGIMVNGKHIETKPTDYGPDMFSGFLIDFMTRKAAEGKPFFAYYPMTLPHAPWVSTPDHPNVKDGSPEAFRANVEYADKIIGRLIAALEKAGVRENTLVIFTSDNGTQNWGKVTITEWGPRTPCIISCPGTVQTGKVSGAMVDIPDMLVTILDYAKVNVRNQADLDGRSLMPLLTGKTGKHKEFAVSYYGNYRVIRDEQWLLEGNNDESFGDFYYCGDLRSGISYRRITDFTDPAAKAARARFEAFIASHGGTTKMTAEAKAEFTEFLNKNRGLLIRNLKRRYGDEAPD